MDGLKVRPLLPTVMVWVVRLLLLLLSLLLSLLLLLSSELLLLGLSP